MRIFAANVFLLISTPAVHCTLSSDTTFMWALACLLYESVKWPFEIWWFYTGRGWPYFSNWVEWKQALIDHPSVDFHIRLRLSPVYICSSFVTVYVDGLRLRGRSPSTSPLLYLSVYVSASTSSVFICLTITHLPLARLFSSICQSPRLPFLLVDPVQQVGINQFFLLAGPIWQVTII